MVEQWGCYGRIPGDTWYRPWKFNVDLNYWWCFGKEVSLPGDSIRDLLIPDRWRSLELLKGSLTLR